MRVRDSGIAIPADVLPHVFDVFVNGRRCAWPSSARYDIAFPDIGLPVTDGYELAERLREFPNGQQQRPVAITGYGQAADRCRTTAAGFDEHLVKPVDLEAVRGTDRALHDSSCDGLRRSPGGGDVADRRGARRTQCWT